MFKSVILTYCLVFSINMPGHSQKGSFGLKVLIMNSPFLVCYDFFFEVPLVVYFPQLSEICTKRSSDRLRFFFPFFLKNRAQDILIRVKNMGDLTFFSKFLIFLFFLLARLFIWCILYLFPHINNHSD